MTSNDYILNGKKRIYYMWMECCVEVLCTKKKNGCRKRQCYGEYVHKGAHEALLVCLAYDIGVGKV